MARKILIAAGGTGGHIYPALAMAEAFVRWQPDTRIEFVGTALGLENKIIPKHGFAIHHLPIGRLNSNVSWSERLMTLLRLPLALVRSFFILRAVKPDFVLGVGGHASGPLLLVASLFGYRTAIWEPNAIPGLANRILARYVDDCWVVFEEAKSHLHNRHLHQAGMPVRREIEDMASSQAAVARSDGRFHILVFGGSQGARGLNSAVQAMINEGGDWLKDLHFVHQTGESDFARVRDGYRQDAPVEVRDYLHDMGQQYARADLVISRSGTGTLSELAACGKAAVLIPLPTAADDHQRKNAESLVSKGAAEMIVQKDLTTEALRSTILRLKANRLQRTKMEERIRGFHQARAADQLVRQFFVKMENHATRKS